MTTNQWESHNVEGVVNTKRLLTLDDQRREQKFSTILFPNITAGKYNINVHVDVQRDESPVV